MGWGVNRESINAWIRCYLSRRRQALLLFLYILKLGLHVHHPSIGPEELDTVQYVMLVLIVNGEPGHNQARCTIAIVQPRGGTLS